MEGNYRTYLNDGWLFSPEFSEPMKELDFSGKMESVRIPHTVCTTAYNSFPSEVYQKISCYRKVFKTQKSWQGKLVLLTIEGSAHKTEVYLNQKLLCTHNCGYTAFTADLTKALNAEDKDNVLCIKVDSRETLDQPPFGFVIDYMTYGGIYRDVYLEVKNPVFIEDVFVCTELNTFTTSVTLNKKDEELKEEGFSIQQELFAWSSKKEANVQEKSLAFIASGVKSKTVFTKASAKGVVLWSLENPSLYVLKTTLLDSDGKEADSVETRFGFRKIEFNKNGFYLNGNLVKIRGLNRHQSWPYVGYAMPKNMQKEDADILKYELSLNAVRTSHYPQSRHFIDRCDEIGLLVFTEIPGWQHIGKSQAWREQTLQNVKDMVLQYRNHPCVFMWGVRINESLDDNELYQKTNDLCRSLDPTRPTGGVRYLRNSNLIEDVYTFNDFSYTGGNRGVDFKKNVTKSKKGFLVTEYMGHMYPVKAFDAERLRTEQSRRHAQVLNDAASSKEHAGSIGWCAFDYNTHKDFGSGDYICYHGVMDMFRNPKTAAFVYKSQGERETAGDVLEVSSSMDIGEYPASRLQSVYAFTNAQSIRLYVNRTFIKEFNPKENSPFKSLPHPPILIDDFIGDRLSAEEGFSLSDAKKIKCILKAVRDYGMEKLPLLQKMQALLLIAQKKVSLKEFNALYSKYMGNWGESSVQYKFEAVYNGKVVKTLVKSASQDVFVKVYAPRTLLKEDESYDVAAVHLYAADNFGNIRPFCQEAVTLETSGPLALIGPSAVSLKGGMAATYVKTCAQSGKAALFVTDWLGRKTSIDFTIE